MAFALVVLLGFGVCMAALTGVAMFTILKNINIMFAGPLVPPPVPDSADK